MAPAAALSMNATLVPSSEMTGEPSMGELAPVLALYAHITVGDVPGQVGFPGVPIPPTKLPLFQVKPGIFDAKLMLFPADPSVVAVTVIMSPLRVAVTSVVPELLLMAVIKLVANLARVIGAASDQYAKPVPVVVPFVPAVLLKVEK
jgi:hypothetical protein